MKLHKRTQESLIVQLLAWFKLDSVMLLFIAILIAISIAVLYSAGGGHADLVIRQLVRFGVPQGDAGLPAGDEAPRIRTEGEVEALSRMPFERRSRKRTFALGIQTAHEELVVERDLGHKGPRVPQQLPPSQAKRAERGVFVGEYFEISGLHALVCGPRL